MSVKLLKIAPSTNKQKKLDAYFQINSKTKKVSFGSKNSSTYVNHKNDAKKKNYLARHSKLNEKWNDPMSAGSLSRHILWSKPTLSESIKVFKKKFNLG